MEMTETNSPQQKLTDISLSADEPGEAKTLDEKHASKSNSLKRFFKMSNKRVNEALSSASSEAQKKAVDDELEIGVAEKEKEKQPPKRFHLRLGVMHKHAENSALANNSSGSNVASGSAKSGLKGSLSNYWNSVFKRMHGDSGKHEKQQVDDDAEEEALETEIREEIHTLPISEESDDASKS